MKKYNEPYSREPRIGDWVRFYRNGELVMGIELCTDIGAVDLKSILEVRSIKEK